MTIRWPFAVSCLQSLNSLSHHAFTIITINLYGSHSASERGRAKDSKEKVTLASCGELLPLTLFNEPKTLWIKPCVKITGVSSECSTWDAYYDLTQAYTTIYQPGNTFPIHYGCFYIRPGTAKLWGGGGGAVCVCVRLSETIGCGPFET